MKDGPEIVAGLRRLSTSALEKICAQDGLESRDTLRSLANALLVSEDRTGLYRIANTGDTETHAAFVMGAPSRSSSSGRHAITRSWSCRARKQSHPPSATPQASQRSSSPAPLKSACC